MAVIQCLLWDFGDTLCDERFIWSSGPEWMDAYETFAGDGVGAAWSLGEIDTREFAAELSKRMELDAESIVAHMIERCNHIEFFAQTYAFFKARHLPQAIVTVNPDIFSDIIVPVCEFASSCDAIVTSWEERTTDKRVLGELAIDRLGLSCENGEALLIDNKRSNIDDWISVGGAGYRFIDDDTFARDVAGGIDSLVTGT